VRLERTSKTVSRRFHPSPNGIEHTHKRQKERQRCRPSGSGHRGPLCAQP
jgi:hypothetical protein